MTSLFSRGFRGRPRSSATAGRLPPGQYETRDFPVLSAGPTPHVSLEAWDFTLRGPGGRTARWTWDEFQALPREPVTADIQLRHQVVQVRHGLGGRLGGHSSRGGCRAGRRARALRARSVRQRLHETMIPEALPQRPAFLGLLGRNRLLCPAPRRRCHAPVGLSKDRRTAGLGRYQKPRPEMISRRGFRLTVWAWVELNYRPHAYQAAHVGTEFRRHSCNSLTSRAICPDCLPRMP
jgi:hypothetical protein